MDISSRRCQASSIEKGNVPEPSQGGPYLATPELSGSGAIAAPLHSAQSSVRVNATLLHPLVTSSALAYTWDHRAYGAVRRVHSFFPYNVTDARTLP